MTAFIPMLSEAAAPLNGGPTSNWLPVLLLLVIGILFAGGTLTMSLLVGPSRTGPGKESTYESGVNPVGDSRKRFNVRFYVVAMIFLVFDVDIIFFYPLCSIFRMNVTQNHAMAVTLFADVVMFFGLLLVAYFYAWGKGVFKWD